MLINNLKISVIMSVFNHQDYVADAIESILDQTHKNFEFLIINDGSTDDSLKIIQKYEKLDSRIIVINQVNLGLTKALNSAIKKCSGAYIARQDADDLSALNRLEKQLDAIQKYKLDILTSRAFKNSQIVPNGFILNFNQSSILKTGNIFIHGTFFIDRGVFDIQMYDENYRYAQDFKFILDALSNNFKIGSILEPLYYLNDIESSISNTKKREQDDCVIAALTTHFGDSKFYLYIKNCNRPFKNIFRLILVMYLYSKRKNYEFKVIKED